MVHCDSLMMQGSWLSIIFQLQIRLDAPGVIGIACTSVVAIDANGGGEIVMQFRQLSFTRSSMHDSL